MLYRGESGGRMKNNVTMKDIADRLGVSSVTVSKALNDKEGVSDELREQIKEIAQEMGYRYNFVARAMKEGLTHNIGVVIPERFTGFDQSFYLKVYQHIAKVLEESGYYGILNILSFEDEKNLTLPRVYNERRVDGLIILGQITKSYIDLIKNIDMPIVFLDFYDESADVDSIITDNFYGAYEITNYLIQNGHQEIAYVGNLFSTSSIQDRFLGYYKSLLEHHIEMKPSYIINDRDDQGSFIDMELPTPLPSAFVCNCDQVAHILIQKLKEHGINVPGTCSVVGFDNDVFASITEPSLTTVEVDINGMARSSVRYILEKVKDNQRKFGRVLVKGRIIFRDSVKEINTR